MSIVKRWTVLGGEEPALVWHERLRLRSGLWEKQVVSWREWVLGGIWHLYWYPAHWLRGPGFWEPAVPHATPRYRELVTGLRLRFWKVLERRAAEAAVRPLRIRIERMMAAEAQRAAEFERLMGPFEPVRVVRAKEEVL